MKQILSLSLIFFLISSIVVASTNEVSASKETVQTNQISAKKIAKPAPVKPKRIPTRELVKQLSSASNNVVLVEIIEQIGKQDCGSRYVLDAFSELLNHKDEDVRQAVLDAACTFDSQKRLLSALINCLNDPSESIREDSADILGDIETRDMIGAFVYNLTNQYEDVRDNCEFYLLFHTDEDFTNATGWVNWWASNQTSFVFE